LSSAHAIHYSINLAQTYPHSIFISLFLPTATAVGPRILRDFEAILMGREPDLSNSNFLITSSMGLLAGLIHVFVKPILLNEFLISSRFEILKLEFDTIHFAFCAIMITFEFIIQYKF